MHGLPARDLSRHSAEGSDRSRPDSGVVVPMRQQVRVYEHTGEFLRDQQPRVPVYLFCPEYLKRQAETFLGGFGGLVSYAVKANPHPLVLEALSESGVRAFDVASPREIHLAQALGIGVQVHYNNPVKCPRDIAAAFEDLAVRSFALDDRLELDKLRTCVDAGAGVELSVRYRLDGGSAWYDFGSKFGATPRDAAELLRMVATAGFEPSLAFHPGSQCSDPSSYARHIQAAAEIAREANVTIHRLNVGGGFPVPYRDCEVPALQRFFTTIDAAVSDAFGSSPPALVCEPGRAIAAPTTSLVCRVTHRRANGNLFLNDGIYGGLMEQLLVPLRSPVRAWREGELLAGRTREVTVFGPTCDCADRLPHPIPLPRDIQTGDWVEFGMAGAYGSATATGFNGFRSDTYVQVRRGFPLDTDS